MRVGIHQRFLTATDQIWRVGQGQIFIVCSEMASHFRLSRTTACEISRLAKNVLLVLKKCCCFSELFEILSTWGCWDIPRITWQPYLISNLFKKIQYFFRTCRGTGLVSLVSGHAWVLKKLRMKSLHRTDGQTNAAHFSVVGSNLSCKASLGSFTTYIRGVVVSVLASSVVYRGFQPWSSQTENYHKNVDIKFSAARHVSGITFQIQILVTRNLNLVGNSGAETTYPSAAPEFTPRFFVGYM
jgi:hypothetical protein